MSNTPKKFVDVDGLIQEKNPSVYKIIPGFLIKFLSEKIVHESFLNAIMTDFGHVKNFDFCREICGRFNVKVEVRGAENIPTEGGVIFAANHPLGGMDAIAVMSAIDDYRTDVKFLVNDLLMNIQNLKELFVGVNKFGTTARDGIKAVDEAFAGDGALFIFPAGMVSRMTQYRVIRDLEWKKTFIAKAKKYKKPIVPVHISGQLSNTFYRVSKLRKFLGIKMNLEMLLLSRETLRQGGNTIVVEYGAPILPETLDRSKKPAEWAYEVKKKVYELSEKASY
jgi:putative hemolysin